MSGKFALIIGNTEYTDSGLAQLTAPGKDTEDFARVLKDQDICAFDDVNVLLNQPSYTVGEAIDEFFTQKKPDDLLVFYFSGHGVRDEFGALFLAVKNTNLSRLRATAIKSDFIRESMDQSRSKRQVLILDCCNSGAFSQGTKAAMGVSIGTASAFEGGYGRIILTASDSLQFAWEGDKVIGETENSLFTHFLVGGLEGEADLDGDGRITVDELYDYAYEQVRLATPKQTPSKFSSQQKGEIVLRQSIRVEEVKPAPLHPDLIAATENTITLVREGAIKQLENLLKGRDRRQARSAGEALKRIATEDDSYRLRLLAAQVLESIQQEGLKQKAEEERRAKEEEDRFACERAEAERQAEEGTQRLARQKAEEERLARERAEAKSKAEKEKTARQQAERKADEKAAREQAERENAKREAAQKKVREREIFFNNINIFFRSIWDKSQILMGKFPRSIPKLKPTALFFSILAPLVILTIFLVYRLTPNMAPDNITLPFSGVSAGKVDVYWYDGKNVTKITRPHEGASNWSPAVSSTGHLYFTSDRSGRAEIWVLMNRGELVQVTDTPRGAKSWSPAVSLSGHLYFTSDRSGTAEIWVLTNQGELLQITDTSEDFESWSPAVGVSGHLYFTSNRSGKAEIWVVTNKGELLQITDTPGEAENWSPSVGPSEHLYFTSNRSGKAEIWVLTNEGELLQVTDTPGEAESWSPVSRSQNVFYTSDRSGENKVYMLSAQAQVAPISTFESWTERWANPFPYIKP